MVVWLDVQDGRVVAALDVVGSVDSSHMTSRGDIVCDLVTPVAI